jgi:hypothetical protein
MPVAANDARVQRVAFAHLVGNDIDYLMKKYEITLGRKAKNYTPDVIMGDTMSVSRQHAKIVYNFDASKWNRDPAKLIQKREILLFCDIHLFRCLRQFFCLIFSTYFFKIFQILQSDLN